MSDTELLALLQPIVDRVRTDVSAVKVIGGDMFRSDDALTHARLVGHIHGPKIRGAYLIKPGESVCRAAVLDLDDHGKVWTWEDIASVASRLIKAGSKLGLKANAWSSSSGHGIHLWYLWDEPQDAFSVRSALGAVLKACMLKSGAGGLEKDEVEVFPKQSEVALGAYGNQVWLPLGGISRPLDEDLIDGTLRPVPIERVVGIIELTGVWAWAKSNPVEVLDRPVVEPRALRVLGGVSDLAIARDEQLGDISDMLEYVKDYSYDHWLRVGFALNEACEGSDEGLELWDEWSARGPEYVDGACATKWATMARRSGGEVIGLGSLRKWARDGGWTGVSERDFQDLSVPVVGAGSGSVDKDPMSVGGNADLPTFERDKEGRILPTVCNLIAALPRADLIGGALAFDSFLDELMIARRPGQWESFTDTDYMDIRVRMENKGRGFKPINDKDLRGTIALVAMRQKFDSAQVWLGGLKWDGVPRVKGFLENYFGAAASEYSVAVSEYMWTALAGRVMAPGCQLDMMPILVGNQGAGKSQGIKAMCPSVETFCEISFDEKDDNVARKLRGVLVAEVAELRGLGTRDEESIKAFLTRQDEKWIPKFKEFSTTFARRVVMFGTTNDSEFLGDVTGNRRYLPFNVGARAGRADTDVRPDLIDKDRDQLWAEALYMWSSGGVRWERAQELAIAEHAQFMIGHPWEDAIMEWIVEYSDVVNAGATGGLFVSNKQIFSSALGIHGRVTGGDGRVLARVMTRLGFRKTLRDSGRVRGWQRV